VAGPAAVPRATAGIRDLQGDQIVLVADDDLRAGRAGVLERVGQRLLDDPERRQVERRGQRPRRALDPERDRQPRLPYPVGQPFSEARAIAGAAALTLVVPFIAYVCSVLRAAEGPDGWLAGAALAAGITGVALKLGSGAPELAVHRAHLAAGTPLHAAVSALAGGATVLSLYPLAVFCAAAAIVGFRARALPRWLAAGAAVTSVALAVNGGFLGTSSVPALILFALWTLLASVYLLRQAWRTPAYRSAPASSAASAAQARSVSTR
jgi:hypothetical protein